VIAQDPVVCVACLADKSDQFTYYLNTLNPQYPKIKKANELLKKFEDKRFEMGELFKIEEFERSEKKEEDLFGSRSEKKKGKFERFDESMGDLEDGNWRVMAELEY
jgi:hypothetical protein